MATKNGKLIVFYSHIYKHRLTSTPGPVFPTAVVYISQLQRLAVVNCSGRQLPTAAVHQSQLQQLENPRF